MVDKQKVQELIAVLHVCGLSLVAVVLQLWLNEATPIQVTALLESLETWRFQVRYKYGE